MELEKYPKTRMILRKLLQLEDRLLGKPFPTMARRKQITVYTCGPATLEMLFSFVGVKVSQTSLIKSIRAWNKIKRYGVGIGDMAKAVSIAGKKEYSFWKKEFASIRDIDLVINKYNFPVGVEWQGIFYENEDEDSGHYGVVTKVDKKSGYLRLADPYFNGYFSYKGTDRKLTISKFKKNWWDINEVKTAGTSKTKKIRDTRMMFVIAPKKEKWPKKFGMVRI
jgi:hypothetical protein